MFESLDSTPDESDAFFWSDYVELRALTHPDKCFSRADLASVSTSTSMSGRGSRQEERWRSLISFCEIREKEFVSSYPFHVSADKDTLELAFDGGPQHRLYLGLLIASCMKNVKNSARNAIARDFEETCFAVFSKLMPVGSEVRQTWANGGSAAPYPNKLYEKMLAIAKDIRAIPTFEESDFKSGNSGDGGIDLISWHPMADDRPGLPIAFAQCGCSRTDWVSKQVEASPFRHSRRLVVTHEWATYYFMPIDMRDFDGKWANRDKIEKVIMVDRLRLVRLAEQFGLYGTLPNFNFVEDALTTAVM